MPFKNYNDELSQESFIKPKNQKDNPALDPVTQDLGKLIRRFTDWSQVDLFKNSNLQNVGALGVSVLWGQG